MKNGKTYSLPIGEQYVGIELYVKNKKTGETVAVWGTIEKNNGFINQDTTFRVIIE